ncbi:kinesin-like protein KIN-7E isoform X2 [Glycine soja]|uniref:Kinesin-like protein n=2 Tax=Glycine soja TaxID=3848 RepID=A0A445HKY7_GLYSO|nr:kinesin-like protein KIN-7E isoform X2 [Glycine soja]RZB74123.1 Kinesin-like protein KIN-7E isoform C [Glycine soja]RZB74124.1 Kinesin-like protein KIN-7E isoform D [Glycine soja]RZB74125.1 Kinesin-like protein KIN-7E isoform E [Glycine soja]RZB74129.1 Kinesin-like protein KIN-7E isoform I [Glycine soja]
MGAIAGEELLKWEKMQGVSSREEKILVSIRLRPLNEKEIAANESADWECINDTTILYRNTLREGSTFPSAYTFDRVFRGDCVTRQVYEEGAKEVALSVVSGINSSIFAYGQTSSGKTYTMVGITEYAVADIFDYITRHEERAFILKFSAIEIYNEIVRDLLSTDNTPLRLRDDPEKGPILEKLTEETLRDWEHLKELLAYSEAQRQVGETYLNEKSSRSHQIIRLTMESSAREFLGKGNSATLVASVNLVDLAGSERASQASSAGMRLKEGCHINRSLLTLGTVIRKLSKGRHGHINYRDSKLTRILQPCLGGNARTAIICTLSPARSHVEQTRNTLLFACCAKEVTTKAQVNVVMSDKALVKHLQKEVARLESELKTPGPATSNCDYAALLRKKDLQIEKMEKEIRELTKQRDLAQSRVEDLLRMVGKDQISGKEGEDIWEDDCSVSESSSICGPHRPNTHIREFNNPHYNDGDSDPDEDPDDYCKEVRCVENGELALPISGDESGISQEISSHLNEDTGDSQIQENSTLLEQRLHVVQSTIDSLVCPSPDEQSPQVMSENNKNLRLTRSWSCTEYHMTGSPESVGGIQRTPANGYEKGFPGRPDGLQKFPPLNYDGSTKLLRNGSQSSMGSLSVDDLRASSIRTSADEDITSIHTFVAGMKEMVKQEYEKHLVDGQDQETGRKNVKDVGVDPMLEAPRSPLDWSLQFKRQQKEIIELWQSCCVPLTHRTYFFLLFRGDPTDSIYMEVELRRLSFLKESFSDGNQSVSDSQTITLASSVKALRRERGMLVKLMQRRLSEKERRRLYEEWGIALDSKRRRVQLGNRLWSENDMNHVMQSATIVAKLVRFWERGKALKEMFGLSFTPQLTGRRSSYPWKNSSTSLL